MQIKKLIRRGINMLGFDIARFHNSPANTILGLKSMQFRSIIDVGANEGQFARKISSSFPQAEIFCFEPLEQPFTKLSTWAATQKGRVQCFNMALGDQEGEVDMHFHQEHSPSSSLLAATDQCHELYPQTRAKCFASVKLSTLDQALKKSLDRMPRDLLLKLDVQGFEDRVLRGARHVLAECSACLLEVSLAPLYEEQAEFRGLIELLYENGFKYAGNLNQTYDKDGRVVFLDAVFVRK